MVFKARGWWPRSRSCTKIIFWRFVFLCVNLALLNPIKSFSWRGCVVQATKNEEESCSFLDAIGRRSCGPLSGLAKNRHVGKPKLHACDRLKRIETAGRYATVRFATLLWLALQLTVDSTIKALLQQTTNICKIPAQTDVTCSWVLLQLCSKPSILLISSTIWCRLWLISAPLLSESNQRKNRRENCSTAASQSGCVHLGSMERARYATKHVRDADSDYVMKNHRGAAWAPFWDRGRLLQAVSKSLVLLKTPLLP